MDLEASQGQSHTSPQVAHKLNKAHVLKPVVKSAKVVKTQIKKMA